MYKCDVDAMPLFSLDSDFPCKVTIAPLGTLAAAVDRLHHHASPKPHHFLLLLANPDPVGISTQPPTSLFLRAAIILDIPAQRIEQVTERWRRVAFGYERLLTRLRERDFIYAK